MTMHTLITVLQSGAGALLGLEHLHDLNQSCSPCDWPKASTTSTGSTSKGVEQYSENMVHIVLSTVLALVRSVAVHSMNTSFVSSVICITQIIKSKAILPGSNLLTVIGWDGSSCSSFQEAYIQGGAPERTAEWAPLMMGGRDRTVRLASIMTG
jgi:hypothetical protein